MPIAAPKHKPPRRISPDGVQAKIRRFRSSSVWQKCRNNFINKNPTCVLCKKDGFVRLSDHAHHIKPLIRRFDLKLDQKNLAALCSKCHSRVEAMERLGEATEYLFGSINNG